MQTVLFFVALVVVCQAGGPYNIEIHRVDLQVDNNQFNNLKNNAWSKALSIDCYVSLMNNRTTAKLSVHGASSRSYRKLSFSLKFSKEAAPKINLFNYRGDKAEKIRNFVLNAAWVDGTFMRNKLTWDLALEIGGVAPRTVWGELFINGQYEGFYLIVEHVGDEMWKRLGWNDDNANVYKAVSHDGNFQPKSNALSGYEKKNNEAGPSDDLTNLLRVLARTPRTFTDFERDVQPVINIRDWFTYLFTCVYANNIDGFDKNYYLYHDQTTQSPFRIIPWDSDATWGNSWTGYPEAPGSNLWGADGMSQRIFAIAEYKFSYLTHFKCLIEQGAFRSDNILAKVNAWANAIGSYVQRDEAKWFPVGRIDNRPFNLEVQDLRNYVTQRSTNFLRAVNRGLQEVSQIGRDMVEDTTKRQPYFTCGVSASQKKPKANKSNNSTSTEANESNNSTSTEANESNSSTSDESSPQISPVENILSETICQGDSRRIVCPPQSVIRVIAAAWGRTDLTTCAAPNMGNTNCRAEAAERVNSICGGRSECSLVGHNDFWTNPCPGVHKYLSFQYSCVSENVVAQAVQGKDASYVDVQESFPRKQSGLSPEAIGLMALGVAVVLVGLIVTAYMFAQREQPEERP